MKKDDLDLEGTLRRLEEIVEKLEGDRVELEDALKLFDEGMSLIKETERKLAESEGRVQQILIDREGREEREDLDLGD